MKEIRQLVQRADRYAARHDLKRTTVSKKLFRDWRRLDELATGKSELRSKTLQRVLKQLEALERDDGVAA